MWKRNQTEEAIWDEITLGDITIQVFINNDEISIAKHYKYSENEKDRVLFLTGKEYYAILAEIGHLKQKRIFTERREDKHEENKS